MSVHVHAVGRPELSAFEMPDRFRHDITYFVTSSGESGAPTDLQEGEWWVRLTDARTILEEGTIRIVSPLDSATAAELEISEEQEAWLEWMVRHQVERIRLS